MFQLSPTFMYLAPKSPSAIIPRNRFIESPSYKFLYVLTRTLALCVYRKNESKLKDWGFCNIWTALPSDYNYYIRSIDLPKISIKAKKILKKG